MEHFWKALIVVVALVAAAESLDCRRCPVGALGTCLFSTDVTCNNATESCYKGSATFNATGAFSVHTRGCLDKDLCGKTLTGTLLSVAYSSQFTCCTTDMCNSATSTQLSIIVGLCAAAMSTLSSL